MTSTSQNTKFSNITHMQIFTRITNSDLNTKYKLSSPFKRNTKFGTFSALAEFTFKLKRYFPNLLFIPNFKILAVSAHKIPKDTKFSVF